MTKNLLEQAERKALKKDLAVKCYNECKDRFGIFHVLNYIAYTETLNAFSMMEERGIMRFSIKKMRRKVDSYWKAYFNFMRRNMDDDDWCLVQDYCMSAHNALDGEIEAMTRSFEPYINLRCSSSHMVHADILAQLSVAVKVGDIATALWSEYFNGYKRICGLDFSHDFDYANLQPMFKTMLSIAYELMPRATVIDYNNDDASKAAMEAFDERISDTKFLDDAALRAIGFSDKYREKYSRMLKEHEKRDKKS